MQNSFLKSSDKYVLVLGLLTIVGLFARLYMAQVDPFLHVWDERFHALVSRNLIDYPLVPMLRVNPVIPVDHLNWAQSGVWLHKQPLFLWQMAASMKIFGISEFTLRLPSVVMGTLMIPMVYYCVAILSGNKKISLIAAALFCFSNFHLELVGGMRSMDHNDLALEFYVLASVWAYLMYFKTQKKYWIFIIGVFAGAAILVKWLIGLFVFLIWGLEILCNFSDKSRKKNIIAFTTALLTCCVVFVPWQLYIVHTFPVESAYEYAYNRRHISEALEGHSGSVTFYLERFPQLFGEGICILIFPGLYLYCKSSDCNRKLTMPVLGGLMFVFIFWSFVVASKVISHIFFIAPIILMFLAYGIYWIIEKVKSRIVVSILLVGVAVLSAKPEKIIMEQSLKNTERNKDLENATIYKNVKREMPKGTFVVVNLPDCASFMFYNKGLQAFESFSEDQLESLRRKHTSIALFTKYKPENIPAYILNYPYLVKLEDRLQ